MRQSTSIFFRALAGVILIGGSGGQAAFGDYVNTFDTSVSPLRYDFGGTNATIAFDTTQNTAGAAGSGSAKLSFGFANNSGIAYTADIFPTPTPIYSISFDLLVDPASSFGPGNHGAGYFQVAVRQTDGYNFVDSGYNENLGNPGYAGTPQFGVWEHISIPLNPATTGLNARALTFQDYNNDAIPGTVTYYIDNLQVTTTPAVTPEPASLGLLALGAAGLLRRRSRR